MRITELTTENVKRIKYVQYSFDPAGNMVVVGGENDQGKSSLLDSIMYALAGGKSLPDEPLRRGEKRGRVVLKLDGDESRGLSPMVVTRTFGKGAGLTITAGGSKLASPQALLDEWCSRIGFDPEGFNRLTPKAQADQLKELVGLDFAGLDANRKDAYDARTQVNRERKEKEAVLSETPHYPDTPDAEVSVAELMVQLEAREATNLNNASLVENAASWARRVTEYTAVVDSLTKQMSEAKRLLATANREAHSAAGVVEGLGDANTDEIRTKIAAADDINTRVRSNAARTTTKAALIELDGKSQAFTDLIESVDANKARQLADADFPVDGLGFDGDIVTFNGLPYDQAASSTRALVGVGIGAALNPLLPVLLVRDGSFLGDKRLRELGELAAKYQVQVVVERVSQGAECSVIIEAGRVKPAEPQD